MKKSVTMQVNVIGNGLGGTLIQNNDPNNERENYVLIYVITAEMRAPLYKKKPHMRNDTLGNLKISRKFNFS